MRYSYSNQGHWAADTFLAQLDTVFWTRFGVNPSINKWEFCLTNFPITNYTSTALKIGAQVIGGEYQVIDMLNYTSSSNKNSSPLLTDSRQKHKRNTMKKIHIKATDWPKTVDMAQTYGGTQSVADRQKNCFQLSWRCRPPLRSDRYNCFGRIRSTSVTPLWSTPEWTLFHSNTLLSQFGLQCSEIFTILSEYRFKSALKATAGALPSEVFLQNR